MKMKVDYSHFERVTLFCNLLHGTFPHKIKACFTDGLLHYANSLEFYIKPQRKFSIADQSNQKVQRVRKIVYFQTKTCKFNVGIAFKSSQETT